MIAVDGAASVGLLAVGIGSTLRSPARMPDGALAVLAAAAAVGLGLVGGGAAVDAVHPLVSPLLFLLLAAPLASMLDEVGVFEAAASIATGRPLVVGGVVVTLLLIGFLVGRSFGVPAWVVVAVADVGLLAVGARPRVRRGPFSTAAAAAALAVLAAGVAAHIDIAALLTHTGGRVGELRTIGVGAGASALTNNLPALLVLLPSAVGVRTVAALLLGLNLGPVIVITGSLSGLLWMDAARRAGLRVGALDYARFGLLAGGPALIAATAIFVLAR